MSGSAPGGARTMEVKICGCRTPGDAEAAARAGADYVGLVFAASPRRVTPERAKEIAAAGRPARTVGVFVDAPSSRVREVAERVGLYAVQLHGNETPEEGAALKAGGLRVWKALRPRSRGELRDGVARYAGVVDAVLVEGFSRRRAGGTGTGLPHEWLAEWPPRGTWIATPPRLILAGGLDPENVAGAVRQVRPHVVDVSSGVERTPWEKDPELVFRFVRRALEAAMARDVTG